MRGMFQQLIPFTFYDEGLFNLFVLGSCTFRSAQGVSGKGWHDDPITLHLTMGLSCKNCFLVFFFFLSPTPLSPCAYVCV